MSNNKTCGGCKLVKSLDEFNKNKAKKDGLNSFCRKCNSVSSKKYYRLNREKHLNNVKKYKSENITRTKAHKLGVSESEVEVILKNSDGRCAICLKEKLLCIDHDHTTMRVRGLLCQQCNAGLGLFYDDEKSLKRALLYLQISVIMGICIPIKRMSRQYMMVTH